MSNHLQPALGCRRPVVAATGSDAQPQQNLLQNVDVLKMWQLPPFVNPQGNAFGIRKALAFKTTHIPFNGLQKCFSAPFVFFVCVHASPRLLRVFRPSLRHKGGLSALEYRQLSRKNPAALRPTPRPPGNRRHASGEHTSLPVAPATLKV